MSAHDFPAQPVSIVLIDRRPLTRQCLRGWLQDSQHEFQIAAVSSCSDVLDDSRSSRSPDLVLLSIGAARVEAPEVLERIQRLSRSLPEVPLILLSDHDDLADVAAALDQGVRGYIPTSLEPAEAAAAIQYVAGGGTFVPAASLLRFAQASKRNLRDLDKTPLESLTPREVEVLARLRQGKPNKVIAYELDICESTVKVFVRQILTKLNAVNRTEVAYLTEGHFDASHSLTSVRRPRSLVS
jgi:DNA-binding NarL/FixJ family response regulator